MKKLLLPIAACLLLTGCGTFNKLVAHVTGYTTTCVKETGVEYIQFPSGAAPLYAANGTLVTCK